MCNCQLLKRCGLLNQKSFQRPQCIRLAEYWTLQCCRVLQWRGWLSLSLDLSLCVHQIPKIPLCSLGHKQESILYFFSCTSTFPRPAPQVTLSLTRPCWKICYRAILRLVTLDKCDQEEMTPVLTSPYKVNHKLGPFSIVTHSQLTVIPTITVSLQ